MGDFKLLGGESNPNPLPPLKLPPQTVEIFRYKRAKRKRPVLTRSALGDAGGFGRRAGGDGGREPGRSWGPSNSFLIREKKIIREAGRCGQRPGARREIGPSN